MRRLLGCGTLILILIGAWIFVRGWNKIPNWGSGTGSIAHQASGAVKTTGQKAGGLLHEIASDPLRFKGSRRTVTGRVRSATKIASNRNLYLLVEGRDRIMVIDDKPAPKAYYPRTVSGVVQVIGPPIGGLNYAYLTDVKSGVKVNPPKWDEVKGFFVGKYDEVSDAVKKEL